MMFVRIHLKFIALFIVSEKLTISYRNAVQSSAVLLVQFENLA